MSARSSSRKEDKHTVEISWTYQNDLEGEFRLQTKPSAYVQHVGGDLW